jgi:hypothetical protein
LRGQNGLDVLDVRSEDKALAGRLDLHCVLSTAKMVEVALPIFQRLVLRTAVDRGDYEVEVCDGQLAIRLRLDLYGTYPMEAIPASWVRDHLARGSCAQC